MCTYGVSTFARNSIINLSLSLENQGSLWQVKDDVIKNLYDDM
jgi:hypothetical protein